MTTLSRTEKKIQKQKRKRQKAPNFEEHIFLFQQKLPPIW